MTIDSGIEKNCHHCQARSNSETNQEDKNICLTMPADISSQEQL